MSDSQPMLFDLYKATNEIEGVVSRIAQGKSVINVTIQTSTESLLFQLKHFKVLDKLKVPSVKIGYELGEPDNTVKIDYKRAGQRLGNSVQEAIKKSKLGDYSDFLEEELIRSTKFTGNTTILNGLANLKIEFGEDQNFLDCLAFRKELKTYITEALKLEITPAVFRGPDDIISDLKFISVTIVGCSEKFYMDVFLEHYKTAFANTMLHVAIKERGDLKSILNNSDIPKHTINGVDLVLFERFSKKYI